MTPVKQSSKKLQFQDKVVTMSTAQKPSSSHAASAAAAAALPKQLAVELPRSSIKKVNPVAQQNQPLPSAPRTPSSPGAPGDKQRTSLQRPSDISLKTSKRAADRSKVKGGGSNHNNS